MPLSLFGSNSSRPLLHLVPGRLVVKAPVIKFVFVLSTSPFLAITARSIPSPTRSMSPGTQMARLHRPPNEATIV
ncbi:hypothetical protein Nepgr_009715 [Nepenthes gracilis]|uniref:Uncharacterized protein n=1 Tax=Nepenthes gracilis TaxID=150966 RepID=A0AAD3XKM0_NEPGR|nr:hypothetical protein Nepgr_009715 [Nepenthes gracilis]